MPQSSLVIQQRHHACSSPARAAHEAAQVRIASAAAAGTREEQAIDSILSYLDRPHRYGPGRVRAYSHTSRWMRTAISSTPTRARGARA